jgi:ubiquinone/menaquinone biosynthesis C-methylase UbiE
MLCLRPGERVIEVACGTGRTLPFLARQVGSDGAVVGVDRSTALIRRARHRVADSPNVSLIAGDWLQTELDLCADAGLCVLGLSVIDRWEMALKRLLAAVRPGGRVVVVDWLVDQTQSSALNAYIRLGSWCAQAKADRPIVAAVRDQLDGADCHQLPLGLRLVAGFVPA